MCAGLGLDQLQCRTNGVGGGIGSAAQQSVGLAHLHQHGAEVVALHQGCAALFGAHLALAQIHHGGHHGVHLGISGRVEDGDTGDIEAVVGRCGANLAFIAHQDHVHQVFILQTERGLQDARIGTFGKHDGAALCFQVFSQLCKHIHSFFLHSISDCSNMICLSGSIYQAQYTLLFPFPQEVSCTPLLCAKRRCVPSAGAWFRHTAAKCGKNREILQILLYIRYFALYTIPIVL